MTHFQLHRVVSILLIAILCSNCAMTGDRTTWDRQAPANIAVVAAGSPPEVALEGFAHDKLEGATTGAGRGLSACLSGLGSSNCSGSICGVALLILLTGCGVVAAAGGILGAHNAPTGDEALAARVDLLTLTRSSTLQDSLRDAVIGEMLASHPNLVLYAKDDPDFAGVAGDYRTLAARNVDAVLEVGLVQVGTRPHETGFGKPRLVVYLQAQAKLVRTRDNQLLHTETATFEAGPHLLEQWSADQAKRLREAIARGFETLGRHLYEQVFLLFPFPDPGYQHAGFLSAAFGLAPLSPETRGQLSGDTILGSQFEWKKVNSLQPELKWQAFPREMDRAADPDTMSRIHDVRYELIIAPAAGMIAQPVVYHRAGLTVPAHRPDHPLSGHTNYFWSVRAHFELDGRARVTPWASVRQHGGQHWTAPSRYSYRFRTP